MRVIRMLISKKRLQSRLTQGEETPEKVEAKAAFYSRAVRAAGMES